MSKKRVGDAISPDYLALGNKLSELRTSLDLSQAEAAKKIGIPQSTYSGYETGKRKITLTKLRDVAEAFGVDVDCLLGTGDYENQLSQDEKIIIEGYRRSDEQTRDMIKRLLRYYELFKEKGGNEND